MIIRLLTILILIFFTSCAKYQKINFDDNLSSSSYQTANMMLSDSKSVSNNIYKKRYIKNRYNRQVERVQLTDSFKRENFSKAKQIKLSSLKPSFKVSEAVKVSVDNIPVSKFIDMVFGSVLKLNYSYSDKVKKSKAVISLNMQSKTTQKELFDISIEMLSNNGVVVSQIRSLFQFDEGTKAKAKKQNQTFIYGRDFSLRGIENKKITILFPYYYVNLRNMLRTGFTSTSPIVKNIKEIAGANVLIISGEAQEVHRLLEAARLLDQPSMKKKKASLFKLTYIKSEDFKKRVVELLRASGIPIAKSTTNRGVLIVDVPELNALYAVSSKQSWLDNINRWQKRFDNISVLGDESHIFFYKPEYRKAEELIGLINQLLGQSATGNILKDNNSSSSVGGNIREDYAILDSQQNNIMINTTGEKYKEVLRHLEKLDKSPQQVLIEVTIAEVTLSDQLSYGLEWYFKKNNTAINTKSITVGGTGILGTIIDGDWSAIMDAFAKNKLLHVLSSPKLIVLDRESATINVGSQVPILTSSTDASSINSTDTTRTQSVEYRNTGIILAVTPYINSKGVLTLDISQEVSKVDLDASSQINSPTIITRSIQTKIALKSGESVMLGGLIDNTKSKTVNKVPVLGDLPILGNVFKTNSNGGAKTELFITVKPTILKNSDDSKIVTDEIRKLFKYIKK